MEEYGIMEYLDLAVTRCGRWTGNREFIWSGLRKRRIVLHGEKSKQLWAVHCPCSYCGGLLVIGPINWLSWKTSERTKEGVIFPVTLYAKLMHHRLSQQLFRVRCTAGTAEQWKFPTGVFPKGILWLIHPTSMHGCESCLMGNRHIA